jgi:hypothetical protein
MQLTDEEKQALFPNEFQGRVDWYTMDVSQLPMIPKTFRNHWLLHHYSVLLYHSGIAHKALQEAGHKIPLRACKLPLTSIIHYLRCPYFQLTYLPEYQQMMDDLRYGRNELAKQCSTERLMCT